MCTATPNEDAGGEIDAWARRAQEGDEAAASQLYDRLYPLVLRIVRAHQPRRTSEEDLVQLVFLRAFTKLDQFSGNVPFVHWLARIAVNTCAKQLKYEKVRRELRWADLSEQEEHVLRTLMANSADLPAADWIAARELVGRLLCQLAPSDRLIVTLLYLEGRSVDDICQLSGWSRAMVKVRAFRARRKMKRHLQQLLRDASS